MKDVLVHDRRVPGATIPGNYAKFDVDGASGTLAAYADAAVELGSTYQIVDGASIQLGSRARFTAVIAASSAGVRDRPSHCVLARPTPCSALMLPP